MSVKITGKRNYPVPAKYVPPGPAKPPDAPIAPDVQEGLGGARGQFPSVRKQTRAPRARSNRGKRREGVYIRLSPEMKEALIRAAALAQVSLNALITSTLAPLAAAYRD